MKKAALLVLPFLFLPIVASAATLSAAQVNAIITLLDAFGVPQATIHSVYADLTGTPSQTAPVSVSASADYSNYVPLAWSQYHDNPLGYDGQHVIVTGLVSGYVPASGAPGSTNFMTIENPFDQSEPKMELEIDDPASYTAVVNALRSDQVPQHHFVRAYATGVPDQTFTATSLLGTSNIAMPTALVSRLDQCENGSITSMVLVPSTFEDNFSCSSWSAIFPQGIAATAATPTVFTTPSGATVDGSGNVVSTPTPDDATAGRDFYLTNHTCVGLAGNQYSACLEYAINH